MAKPIRHRIVGKMVAKRLGMTRRQEQPRVSSMLQYGSVASQIDNNKTSLDSPANLRTNPFTRSEQEEGWMRDKEKLRSHLRTPLTQKVTSESSGTGAYW